ncbi:MAG: hypothetical protein IJS65_01620 [Clostridia bacterium]|nr:hypothetical protein [Clostridia bacterium]
MRKVFALLLALVMVAAAFAGCGGKKPVEASGVFRTYFTAFPPTLNTWRPGGGDTSTGKITGLVKAGFYTDEPTEDGEGWRWVCELAEDFPQKMDEEGKVWRIKLKKGLKWANGEDLDANDYIYSIKQAIDPVQLNSVSGLFNSAQLKLVKAYDYYMQGSTGVPVSFDEVGVKKIDDYTIELTAEQGVAQINVLRFGGGVGFVNETVYEAGMSEDRSFTDYGTAIDKYVCNGPFMITEWIPDAKITLEKNPYYVLADKIHIKSIEFSLVPNSQTAIELFQQDKLDYCALLYTDWESFEDDPRVYEYFNDSLMYMMINVGNPSQNNLLGSLDFRKALYYGIDRNSIAEAIGVYPATRYVRRSVIGDSNTGESFVSIPQDYVKTPEESYDVPLANQYLMKAYEEKGLESATEQILLSETATHIKAVTEILQKHYNDIFNGKLTVTIRQLPPTQAQTLRRWHEDDPTSFDIALGSLLPSSTDVRDSFKYYISSYNPPRSKWSNPEFDKLYAEVQGLDLYNDTEEIVSKCQQMEKILLDEVVINPVYERPEKVLYSEHVHLPVEHYVIGFGFGERFMTID